MKGAPEAVQVTLLIAMVCAPEARSPFASTVRVGLLADPVRTLAVTDTVELAAILGDVVGLASGKLIVVGDSVSSAREATVALIVRLVWLNRLALPRRISASTATLRYSILRLAIESSPLSLHDTVEFISKFLSFSVCTILTSFLCSSYRSVAGHSLDRPFLLNVRRVYRPGFRRSANPFGTILQAD